MDAEGAMKEATKEAFRLLDKVTEFKFSLALLSVAVALDVTLAWIAHRNILTLDWAAFGGGMMAKLGLALVAYVFWMAALSPMTDSLVKFLLSLLTDNRFASALRSIFESEHATAEQRYVWGRVQVTDAKLRAFKDKDMFWIEQVEKVEANERENRGEMAALARLSFSVLGLMLMDWGMREYSIAGEILAGLGGDEGWMKSVIHVGVLACVLLIAFPWLYQVWNQQQDDAWMSHPELAKERLEAIEAQRMINSSGFVGNVLMNIGGYPRR
ncbi:MAG: hypothetical protein EKK46_04660 [Rhodocyclaceae bacterium]|nr:MAG: hypothetical protein EKK46_04660 [Rhodocyclaceae bacterium]